MSAKSVAEHHLEVVAIAEHQLALACALCVAAPDDPKWPDVVSRLEHWVEQLYQNANRQPLLHDTSRTPAVRG